MARRKKDNSRIHLPVEAYDKHQSTDSKDFLRHSFDECLTVDLGTAAKILGIDRKTLRTHANCGNVTYIDMGIGVSRRRRRFTLEDLHEFLVRRRRRETPVERPIRHKTPTAESGFLERMITTGTPRQQAQARAVLEAHGGDGGENAPGSHKRSYHIGGAPPTTATSEESEK